MGVFLGETDDWQLHSAKNEGIFFVLFDEKCVLSARSLLSCMTYWKILAAKRS